jgi:hypothetical protein
MLDFYFILCYNTGTKQRKEMIQMKNVNELREITQRVVQEKIREQQEKVRSLVEQEIFPLMEQAASEGRWYVEYHVEPGILVSDVVQELARAGYKIARSGCLIKINWL